MRYSALYVEKARKWAVVDTLSGDFAPTFYDTEHDARVAAMREESRWTAAVADARPTPAA